MAAEAIFFKCQSNTISPLVSDALGIKPKALTMVSRPVVIWPLPPPTLSQAPL